MEKPTREIEYEMMLLGRYTHLTSSRARKDGGELDRSAYILLSRLSMQGPMTIRELSEVFVLDQSTVNRQTAAMLREGLVERIADPEEIARRFRVTEEGHRRLNAEREATLTSLDKILYDWTPEEVAVFADCLKRFNGSIEHISGRPWPRRD